MAKPEQYVKKYLNEHPKLFDTINYWVNDPDNKKLKNSILQGGMWLNILYMYIAFIRNISPDKLEKFIDKNVKLARKRPQTVQQELFATATLSTFSSWSITQGVYGFDETIYDELCKTEFKGEIPVDVLYRIPEWGVYIKTPNLSYSGKKLYGIWVSVLEFHSGSYLCIIQHLENDNIFPMMLQLCKGERIEDLEMSGSLYDEKIYRILLSLILYICTDEPEIEHKGVRFTQFSRPQKKIKGRLTYFPAKKVTKYTVGSETGRLIREANTSNGNATGTEKSPHIRKAHWHGYWTGPRKGEQQFSYKWLPPIPVNCRTTDDEVA